ncbi:MAG: hypothetical protein U0892_04665 [Pirellulales bacterium]
MFSSAIILLTALQVAAGGGAPPPSAETSVPRVEIAETSGSPYSAQLQKLQDNGLTVLSGGKPRTVPLENLLRVRFESADEQPRPSADETSLIHIELADGSTLAAVQITSDGKQVSITLQDRSVITVPTKLINSCRFRPVNGDLAAQWQAILQSKISADVIVPARAEQALDKVEGIISKIDEKTVSFSLDGEPVAVSRAKLVGLRFFSASPARSKLLAVLRDRMGSEWMVHRVQGDAASNKGSITLVCGHEFTLPLQTLSEFDFSFGSMRFVAELPALERKVTPRFALANPIQDADKLFGPQTAAPSSERGAVVGPGIDFIGSGHLVVRVPDDFKRLMGRVALAPPGPKATPCKVQLLLVDKVLFEQTLNEPQATFDIDVAIEAGKRLKIVVASEGSLPVGDLVSWRQLRFVK